MASGIDYVGSEAQVSGNPLLMAEAARLAAERRTGRDPKAIARSLTPFAESIVRGEEAIEADHDFHRAIFRAIEAGQPASVRTVMRSHPEKGRARDVNLGQQASEA